MVHPLHRVQTTVHIIVRLLPYHKLRFFKALTSSVCVQSTLGLDTEQFNRRVKRALSFMHSEGLPGARYCYTIEMSESTMWSLSTSF